VPGGGAGRVAAAGGVRAAQPGPGGPPGGLRGVLRVRRHHAAPGPGGPASTPSAASPGQAALRVGAGPRPRRGGGDPGHPAVHRGPVLPRRPGQTPLRGGGAGRPVAGRYRAAGGAGEPARPRAGGAGSGPRSPGQGRGAERGHAGCLRPAPGGVRRGRPPRTRLPPAGGGGPVRARRGRGAGPEADVPPRGRRPGARAAPRVRRVPDPHAAGPGTLRGARAAGRKRPGGEPLRPGGGGRVEPRRSHGGHRPRHPVPRAGLAGPVLRGGGSGPGGAREPCAPWWPMPPASSGARCRVCRRWISSCS